MGRTIIFGATGKLGAYAALYLKEMGHEVIATGRRKTDNGFFKQHNIPYYSANIENKDDLHNLPTSGITNVLHFAAVMPAAMQGYVPRVYIKNIISGTFNILEFCRRNSVERIVYTQSHSDTAHLQGSEKLIPSDIIRSFPLTGDHSIYAICKNASVDFIEHYHHQYGLKRFILRLPTIYTYTPDPYFYVDGVKKMRAYRLLIERARKGKTIEIWGDPTLKKEIVYIKDFCQIVEKAIQANQPGGFYNVGRGIGVTLEEQIRGIVDVFSPQGQKSKIIYRPDMPNAKAFIHDISKTKEELGYEPQYDYRKGLEDFKTEMELNRFEMLWGQPVVPVIEYSH